MARVVELVEVFDLTVVFFGCFLVWVIVTRGDGFVIASPDTTFRGELDDPFDDDELTAKARWLLLPVVGAERTERLLAEAWSMADAPSIAPLLALLSPPPPYEPARH